MSNTRKKLGELLLARRLITHEQLDYAIRVQRENALPLGTILVSNGFLTEDLLLQALAAQQNVSAWHLEKDPPKPEAIRLVPGHICRQYQVLPVQLRGDLLLLAMRNPGDIDAIDLVRNVSQKRIEPVLANEDRLSRLIEQHFGEGLDVVQMDSHVSRAMTEVKDHEQAHGRQARAELAEQDTRPVVGLVNQMLTDAIRMGASDIHIEPRFDKVDIRFRLDGQLLRIKEIPLELLQMLVTRVKIMAELDIVEYRMPQDGRISVQIDGRTVDLRVSVLPNVHGQRIVLRILDKSVAIKPLDSLGYDKASLAMFRSLIKKPYGMFLVTGPTGSGKTTTLYAAINEIRSVARNIMTCEDPVEYELEGINQSQVNEKVGLTFAAQLRAILRQDPDVVLVGEIRDQETAETAIRAALTGHLVLSTLHSNDAPNAIPRLLDMGVEPFLLSTSLIGVMAQRLVRKLCPDCKVQTRPSAEDEIAFRAALGDNQLPVVWSAPGCPNCHGTGFKKRIAIQEIMPITSDISHLIATRAPLDEIRRAAALTGYRTMQEDVLLRVLAGETSMDEAKRVVFFDTAWPQPKQKRSRQAA